jgi:hypothetical protein
VPAYVDERSDGAILAAREHDGHVSDVELLEVPGRWQFGREREQERPAPEEVLDFELEPGLVGVPPPPLTSRPSRPSAPAITPRIRSRW